MAKQRPTRALLELAATFVGRIHGELESFEPNPTGDARPLHCESQSQRVASTLRLLGAMGLPVLETSMDERAAIDAAYSNANHEGQEAIK